MATKDNNTCKITLNGETLIDLTDSTVTPNEVSEGFIFYTATGEQSTGTLKTNVFQYDIGVATANSDKTVDDILYDELKNYINSNDIKLHNGDILIIREHLVPQTSEALIHSYVYDINTGWIKNTNVSQITLFYYKNRAINILAPLSKNKLYEITSLSGNTSELYRSGDSVLTFSSICFICSDEVTDLKAKYKVMEDSHWELYNSTITPQDSIKLGDGVLVTIKQVNII